MERPKRLRKPNQWREQDKEGAVASSVPFVAAASSTKNKKNKTPTKKTKAAASALTDETEKGSEDQKKKAPAPTACAKKARSGGRQEPVQKQHVLSNEAQEASVAQLVHMNTQEPSSGQDSSTSACSPPHQNNNEDGTAASQGLLLENLEQQRMLWEG